MYYNLLIRYHEHHNSYIDICRCYRSIYEASLSCCIPLSRRISLLTPPLSLAYNLNTTLGYLRGISSLQHCLSVSGCLGGFALCLHIQ